MRIGTFPEVSEGGDRRQAHAGRFVHLDGEGHEGHLARPRVRRVRPGSGGFGPAPVRPASVGPRYRGTGVRMSRAPHARGPVKKVTPLTVVGLALTAALITIWLGAVAQFGEAARSTSVSVSVPERLAVVQVQSGETLAHVAARVAPQAPVTSVVERIRELNELDSAVLDAGQTLIAPVG